MAGDPRLSSLQLAQRTARSLVSDGILWRVYELPPSQFDRRGTPSLIFESDGLVRRVRNYPPEWRALTDEALLTLSGSI